MKATRKLIALALAVAIVCVTLLSGCSGSETDIYTSGSTTLKISKGGGKVTIDDKFTDRKITDEKSAILAAKDMKHILGYRNALNGLTCFSDGQTLDGGHSYSLQENYAGIPVYGRRVDIETDADGNAVSFSSNVSDIPPYILISLGLYIADAPWYIAAKLRFALKNEDLAIYDQKSGPVNLVYTVSSIDSSGGYANMINVWTWQKVGGVQTLFY